MKRGWKKKVAKVLYEYCNAVGVSVSILAVSTRPFTDYQGYRIGLIAGIEAQYELSRAYLSSILRRSCYCTCSRDRFIKCTIDNRRRKVKWGFSFENMSLFMVFNIRVYMESDYHRKRSRNDNRGCK
jgi:hypothetical protein